VPSPVLLVHSGGFTSRQWRKLVELLAPAHRVLAPDLLGYGTAAAWPLGEPFHFRQDVDRLATMLAEPTHVVGHSYGGLVALHLALARPELVRSLAVYEPVAFGVLDAADRAPVDHLLQYRPDAAGVDEAWLAAFVDWWNGDGAWRALPDDTRAAFGAAGWKLSQEVASLVADRTDRAGYSAITAPTLLLGGQLSPHAERRVLSVLAEVLPHATLELFPGLGHMGPITHASLVNSAVVAHVTSHDA
jgi:pimeloyl-ACP methyl ester carboxylesterase